MKKIFTSLCVAVAAFCGLNAAAQAPNLYLRGSMPGWNASDCTAQYLFQTSDGEHYTLSLAELKGEFKIADNSWGQYNFGSVQNIVLDQEYTMVNNSNSGNCTLKEGSATNVTINFTLSTATLKITGNSGVFTYPDLYIVGDFTGWGFDSQYLMTRNDNVYTFAMDVFPACEFKVATTDWAPNFGADQLGDEIHAGETFMTADNGNNITNPTDIQNASFTFIYNREGQSSLLITSGASVEGIGVAEGAAEFYTIDGVKVANPDKGIYIKKAADGKVSKVIL